MRLPFNGSFRLTQGFGENPQAYAKFGLKGHNGLDYATPTGTPILAPFAGRISELGNDTSGYGLYVKIENAQYGTILAHLLSRNVVLNQQVSEGQQIGFSDNTGNSTGPHLHWGVHPIPRNRANGYAGYIDQTNLIGKPTEGGATVNPNDIKKAVQFDKLVSELYKRSILATDKSEDYVNDDKLVERTIQHIDAQEAIKQQLEQELASCRASGGSDTATLTEAKTTFKKLHVLLG